MNTNELIIQVHVPFCVRRCAHCTFPYTRYDPNLSAAYTKAVLKEIESNGEEFADRIVTAVAFEGGSPALLSAADLQSIIRSLQKHFHLAEDVQISLQTMPGDYSRALMEKMRDNGVNFWIVGLETVDLKEHELLKRPYRYDALTMVDTALRTFHPRNLSFDLLCGIPGQTRLTLQRTLEKALSYEPDHLSLLPLNIKGTLLFADVQAGLIEPASEEAIQELMRYADEVLCSNGYHAYTPHNYALPGKENRYTIAKMQGCEQLGLGYGALSVLDGYSYSNGHSLEEYLQHPDDVSILAKDITAV